jgi:hypothetical protein
MTGPEIRIVEELRQHIDHIYAQAYQHVIDERDRALRDVETLRDKLAAAMAELARMKDKQVKHE